MQVKNAIGADNVEWRIRTRLSPAGQAWHKPSARKSIRRRDAKRLSIALAPDCAKSGSKGSETVANDWKQPGARVRQR
jgi:hypothetical protein